VQDTAVEQVTVIPAAVEKNSHVDAVQIKH
jgi:hypothetical protein